MARDNQLSLSSGQCVWTQKHYYMWDLNYEEADKEQIGSQEL